MSNNKTWTQEEVRTLTTLRNKKVQFSHIALVLGRSPMACQQKAWSLANPEYIKLKNKRQRKPNPDIKRLEAELKQAHEHIEMWKQRAESAEGTITAIQLNMREWYNRNRG
jgi:hypothetical protein